MTEPVSLKQNELNDWVRSLRLLKYAMELGCRLKETNLLDPDTFYYYRRRIEEFERYFQKEDNLPFAEILVWYINLTSNEAHSYGDFLYKFA